LDAFCNLLSFGELSSQFRSEDTMARQLKAGDKVAWKSSGGGSVGRVERKLTSPAKIKGHEVAASEDNPEFLVRSEKSGAIAAHKPSALRRVQ
jgi:Hypervirulence associated proteins TUDOR domain